MKRTLVRQRPSTFDEPTLADALSRGDPVAIRAFADFTVRRLLGGGLLSHVTDVNLAKTFQWLKLTRPTRDHVQPVAYERMTGRSVSRLGLPAKASNALVRSGIRTVEQVLDSKVVDLAGVNRLGAKSFCQLIRTLARRLEEDPDFLAPGQTDTSPSVSSIEPDQIDLHEAPDDEADSAPSPGGSALPCPPPSLEAILTDWLGGLGEKRRLVVQRHLGFGGNQPESLGDVAADLGVSRACASQMELSAARRLAKLAPSGVLGEAVSALEGLVARHGGLLSEQELAVKLPVEISVGAMDALFVARVLARASKRLKWLRGLDAVGLCDLPLSLVPQIQRELLRLLKKQGRSLTPFDLLRIFEDSSFARRECAGGERSFFAACLRLHPQIQVRDGLLDAPRRARGRRANPLVEALRTIGRPAPLGEILRVANAGLPDAARLSPQQARADLLKKRNRVRHYGNDVFGLRDGSRRRGNSIADVAQRVIAEAGRPLAVTQIVDRVVRELGVRPRSVRICIMTDHRFTRVSRGVYRLADGLPQRTGMLL